MKLDSSRYQQCQMVVLQVKLCFENFMKIFYVWKTKLKYLNKLNGSIDTIYQLTTIAQRKH